MDQPSDHEHWYWWGGGSLVVAVTFLGVAASAHVWTGWPARIAYAALVFAIFCGVAGVKGWHFPGAARPPQEHPQILQGISPRDFLAKTPEAQRAAKRILKDAKREDRLENVAPSRSSAIANLPVDLLNLRREGHGFRQALLSASRYPDGGFHAFLARMRLTNPLFSQSVGSWAGRLEKTLSAAGVSLQTLMRIQHLSDREKVFKAGDHRLAHVIDANLKVIDGLLVRFEKNDEANH